MNPLVGAVAVPRPVRRLFTYSIPPALAERCLPGVRVLVPFGRRLLTGYLVETRPTIPDDTARPLREIEDVLDPAPTLDRTVLDLIRFATDYYLASPGELMRAALPGQQAVIRRVVSLAPAGRSVLDSDASAGSRGPLTAAVEPAARETLGLVGEFQKERGAPIRLSELRKRLGPRLPSRLLKRLCDEGMLEITDIASATGPPQHLRVDAVLKPRDTSTDASAGPERALRGGAARRRLIEVLNAAGGRLPVRDLLRRAGAGGASLRALEKLGLVTRVEERESRRPFALGLAVEAAPRLVPTADQAQAIDSIHAALRAPGFSTFLLHGVTGSGKTEVYLRSIETVVAAGRTALYLVPEISLTPLLSRRLRSRFGEVLALLHSGLTEGERQDEWRRIRDGRVRVVLGARSAVFAPLQGVGLIVVDEEQDASYKQEEHPRYNGRDLAIMRGKIERAVVVLGSATPSVETFFQAERGRHTLLRLPARIGSAGLPSVERVDMRREFREVGHEAVLSRRLLAALRERLDRGEQSLVLLNRRGFSTFALCRACGAQIQCRDCSIPMTLHRRDQRLRCHYCAESRRVPEICPACRSRDLHFGGTGTERLEEIVRSALPRARIERLDSDTARGRGSVENLLTRVERGEVDVLLGTQMIAKGHDFPNVTLVGVLAADALLALPDFRAGERAFQLLSQVAGRSGRGERPGEVIVQAYDPDHHAIRFACAHDYEGFAARELGYRRALRYPPHAALAVLLIKDRSLERAQRQAAGIASSLRTLVGADVQVLGPAPAPLERLRGDYRVQILVKTRGRARMQAALSEALLGMEGLGVPVDRMSIDVDPVSTL